MKFRLDFSEKKSLYVNVVSEFPLTLKLGEKQKTYDLVRITEHYYSLIFEGNSYFITMEETNEGYSFNINGKTYRATVQSELKMLMDKFGYTKTNEENAGEINAAIPGLLTKIFVKVGDELSQGDHLCVLEAMKMENEIKAPISGKVKKINIKEGGSVEKGNLIMEICPND